MINPPDGPTDPIDEYERLMLAPYAMRSSASSGRRHNEPVHSYRGPYQRDRDRIVHSAAYRRLSYKTQVFTGELGDYHRTRLTHTLEVASIARTVARALRLNEDLVEALALIHDIGHPPFGHAGEEVLNACLSDNGGFNHNLQALRIVERIEIRYSQFAGLNLTSEVLAGQARRVPKHLWCGGQLDARDAYGSPMLEVQAVDAADSIAYNTHDADDALELGLLSLSELIEQPLWQEAARRAREHFSGLDGDELRRAVLHELIDWQVGDLLRQSRQLLAERQITTVADVRRASPIAIPSKEVVEPKRLFEAFLFDRVYRHSTVLATRQRSSEQIGEMFTALSSGKCPLPSKFQVLAEAEGAPRAAADYLAGMTDRYARQEYRRLRRIGILH